MMASSGLTTRFWISCGRGARLGDDDVGCRHHDLRVVFARSDEQRHHAGQRHRQHDHGGDLRFDENAGELAGDIERSGALSHGQPPLTLSPFSSWLTLETTTLSPGFRPDMNFHPALLGRAGAHHAIARDALGVDHEHAGDARALGQGRSRHANPFAAADGKPHANEIAAGEAAARGQVDLDQMGMAGRVGRRHHLGDHAFDRRQVRIAIGRDADLLAGLDAGVHVAAHLGAHLEFLQAFDDQHRPAGGGKIAGIGHFLRDDTVDRRHHRGIAHLAGRQAESGAGGSNLLLGDLVLQADLVPLQLRNGFFLVQGAEALVVELGVGQRGFSLRQPGAGLVHLPLDIGGVDHEQQLAGLDRLPFLDLDLADIAHQP